MLSVKKVTKDSYYTVGGHLLTLTFDTLINVECPDPNTPTHSPLLGNMDPILVHIRFGTPQLR